jgi:hypothetical protein
MSSLGWSYDQVVSVIKQARPVADINSGFEAQLRAYALANYDVYVAQQVLLRGRVRALQTYRSLSINLDNGLGGSKSERHLTLCADGSTPPDVRVVGSKRSWRSSVKGDTGNEDDGHYSDDGGHYAPPHSVSSQSSHGNSNSTSQALLHSLPLASPRNNINNNDWSRSTPGSSTPRMNPNQIISVLASRPTSTSDQHGKKSDPKLRRQIPLMDARSPRCRLSRPGVTAVRVIPPLRGLERVFCCVWCSVPLFNLASVIRTDIDIHPMLSESVLAESKDDHWGGSATSRNASESLSVTDTGYDRIKQDDQRERFDDYKQTAEEKRNELSWSTASRSSSTSSSFKSGYPPPPTTMRGSRGSKAFFNDDSNPSPAFNISSTQSHSSATQMEICSDSHVADEKCEIVRSYSANKECDNDNSNTIIEGTNRPLLNIIMLSPRTGSGSGHAIEESPRIQIPQLQELRNSERMEIGGSDHSSNRHALRPQSAEKRRWLERVNLLKLNQNHNTGEKVAKMAKEDDEATNIDFTAANNYLHVEYLEWMGTEVLSPDINSGEIVCYQCKRTIGKWTWLNNPKISLNGKLEVPIIRIHKDVVTSVRIIHI